MCPTTQKVSWSETRNQFGATTHRADSKPRTDSIHAPCHVQVDEATAPVDGDHDVCGTDIPMKDPPLIQILYRWKKIEWLKLWRWKKNRTFDDIKDDLCQGHSTHDTPSELKTCKSS